MQKEAVEIIAKMTERHVKRGVDQAKAEQRAQDFMQKLESRRQREEGRDTSWTQKARSNKQEEHEEAVQEAKQGVYTEKQLKKAETHFAAVKNNVPAWLSVDNIHTQAGMEYVAQIAELSPNLQKDPNILLAKASRFYYSTDWTSLDTAEFKEAKNLLDATFKEAQRHEDFRSLDRESMVKIFDRRYDLYRTIRIDVPEEILSKDSPTNKSSPDYQQWQKEKTRAKQQRNADKYLRRLQHQLDNPHNTSAEKQAEIADTSYADLEAKLAAKPQRDDEIGLEIDDYVGKDLDPYIDKIKSLRNVTERVAKQQQDEESTKIYKIRNEKERKDKIKELEKEGAAHEWTDDDKARFPMATIEVGDVIHLRGEFKKEDFDLLLSGKYEDRAQWVSRYWQDVFTHGLERKREEITDIYKWTALEKVLDIIHPGDWEHEKRGWKELKDTIGRIDSVVKGIYFSPEPDKALDGLKFMLPTDLQVLFQGFDFSEYTYAIYKDTMMDILRNRMAHFQKTVEQFKGPVGTDDLNLLTGNPKLNALRVKYDDSMRNGKPVTKDMFLNDLQEIYAQRNDSGDIVGFGDLSGSLYDTMMRLQQDRDLCGRGVYIQEKDMRANQPEYLNLSKLQSKYNEKLQELTRSTSSRRTNEIRRELDEIKNQANTGWKELSGNPFDTRGIDSAELSAVSGYSPVEIQLRDRLITYFVHKEKLNTLEKRTDWVKKNEWRIRNAVFAARYATFGWGDALDITARVVRAPTLDLDSSISKTTGSDVMPGTFAEGIVRILNGNLFEDRFNMQGAFGAEIRNIYYPDMFKDLSPDFIKNMAPAHKNAIKEAERQGKPVYKLYIRAAEEYFGVPWSELLRPGYLHTGLATTNTVWRTDIAFIKAYERYMLDLKARNPGVTDDWIIDNQGLSMKFASAGNVSEKKSLLTKMVGRTPSRVIQMLGKDINSLPSASGINFESLEWQQFQTALSNAQMQLWDDEKGLNVQRVNLCDRNDATIFNTVLVPHLEAAGIGDPSRQGVFRQFLIELEEFTKKKDDSGRSLVDKWAEHPFPLTLPIVDFNVKHAQADLLNGLSNVRRINDMNNAAKANTLHFQLISPTLMSPGKDYMEHLKALKEYRNTIMNYDDIKVAERAAAGIARTFGKMNIDRTMYKPIGWVPFSKQIMRGLSEMDFRWAKDKNGRRYKVLNKITNGAWEDLAAVSVSEWPRTVGEAVSLSVKHVGGHGLALNANEWASYVTTLQTDGILTELHDLPKDLKNEQGASVSMIYFYHLPRRFWWVLPSAGISFGVIQSKKDAEQEHKS